MQLSITSWERKSLTWFTKRKWRFSPSRSSGSFSKLWSYNEVDWFWNEQAEECSLKMQADLDAAIATTNSFSLQVRPIFTNLYSARNMSVWSSEQSKSHSFIAIAWLNLQVEELEAFKTKPTRNGNQQGLPEGDSPFKSSNPSGTPSLQCRWIKSVILLSGCVKSIAHQTPP